MNWLAQIFSPIMDVVKIPLEGYNKRQELREEAKMKEADRLHETNMKKLDIAKELAGKGMQIEADWDTNAQQDMKLTWKDEYLTILFSVPLVLSFIPSTQQAILEGFAVLSKTPSWYIALVTGIVASAFGLRWLVSRKGL